ncbi:SIS domain-containing protein [Humidisolicoccus flavus]
MSFFIEEELASQPDCWRQAGSVASEHAAALPQPGERVAVVGCGTSWFMAMSYAVLRESAGAGETDAFAGSEFPKGRQYDRIVAITRSGTTTEVIDLLAANRGTPSTVITGVAGSPATEHADHTVALEFADEQSVVQTRFATTALTFLRAGLGHDVEQLANDAEAALTIDIDALIDAEQITFIGTGMSVGIAQEAALKCREAAQFWTEAYPSMDYRHGPISIAQPGRLLWSFGELPEGLAEQFAETGGTLVEHPELDPQAGLMVAQRFALAKSLAQGLNPDAPRNLTRSVILDSTSAA